MQRDKKILYIFTLAFAILLLLFCFIPKTDYTNSGIAAVTIIAAVSFGICIKKRSLLEIEYRQVAAVMFAAAGMSVALYFLSGLGFGFYKTPFNLIYLTKYIIPIAIIIISAEYTRRIILASDEKALEIIAYFCFLLLDVVLLNNKNIFENFRTFVSFCGMILFPSVTTNFLCHFIAKKYGCLPNIAYKLLIYLYAYLTPVKPMMPESMYAFFKVLLPIFVLYFIRVLYQKRHKTYKQKNKVLSVVVKTFTVLLLTGFIMLISCQFRFGLLVVATESMTGSINKGDAVLYEQYNSQKIEEGQVIVFEKNDRRTIHRVVKKEIINGETRYYTKGDMNDALDFGYITANDIVGINKLKIKYIGYPTVWVRELFNK